MSSKQKSSFHSLVEQTTNNTTRWIGHRHGNNKDIAGGQTFVATKEGDLQSIEVFSNLITDPGKVVMTIHNFDPQQNSWGPLLSSTSVQITKSDTGKWMSFNVPALHLDKGKAYGFRLESPDTVIGVGEAAGSHQQPPFSTGQEWKFINNEQKGDSYSYFSLAFKVGMTA
jgi:N-acetylneuraminic acid mutarotase